MKKEMEKNYNFKDVEDRIYGNWLKKNYFHAEVDKTKEPFTIVIPPPNITGQLHLGHALDTTMQDILIRFKRMQGYNTLWMPGTDHASISTEVKIVDKLKSEGTTKEEIGRDEFLKRAWQWRAEYGGRILEQLKKIGCSCDWERERFTMDEGLTNAVNEVFVRLYEKGYIYRGEKLINWCPNCQTTISDAEVDHEDRDTHFWHLKYKIDGEDDYLVFATTRPETMLGDTAIAVNPKDARYKKYVGKTVTVPVVNRTIPVIADEYVDMELGTGVVKITPAHDPNDYEVGERHNLPRINVMNDDGTMNENAGKYAGMKKSECRTKLVEECKEMGLLVKIEDLKHSVSVHERCGEIIEPLIRLQWFVKMEEMAKPAIDVYKNKELNIIPERFGKVYLNWLENIRDWCISRQLWWGHRIPAYYCKDCGNMEISKNVPVSCKKCGGTQFNQDEDVLDTWFSSALWPFSTLGWPENTEELKHFYPTNVLVTGYDIIFFWVVRMVFSGIEQMGEIPFKDVLMHGIIRDAEGRKMSKSLGNGVDPLEVIDKYGADTLRLALINGTTPGNDSRFNNEKIESSRNFLNKIWNATRFLLMNFEEIDIQSAKTNLTTEDKWILSKVNSLSKEITEHLDNYDLGMAVSKIYDFIWDEFCDWYIEMVKPRLYNKDDKTRNAAIYTLKTVLVDSLKLLHPFMPFITEEIFTTIQEKEETIMYSKWPVYQKDLAFSNEEKQIELIKEAVKGIRNIRVEKNVVPSKKIEIIVVSDNQEVRNLFENSEGFVKMLANANEISVLSCIEEKNETLVSLVISEATIYIPLGSLVDKEKEMERLNKEKNRLIEEVNRCEKKLCNEGFVAKAPENVLNEEKDKLKKYKAMLAQIEKQLEGVV